MLNHINDFVGIGIVGAALSLLIKGIRAKWGTDSGNTKALTIVLSIVVGSIYYFLQGTVLWTTILGVLSAASAFWALFLNNK